MNKLSLTISGIGISVFGTLLLHFGFSEACSNEIIAIAPTLIGGIVAYVGRKRIGDINALGIKK